MFIRRAALGAAVLWTVAACGCGGAKNPIAGEVTRDGKLLERAGLVQFVPDLDKGNDGPTVTLKLEGGRFSSAADGAAMKPGDHLVTVMVAPAGTGAVPAEERRFRVNIPEGGTGTLSFDMTKKPRKKGEKIDPEQEPAP